MTRIFPKYVLRGILALLPILLTVYPLYYFFTWSDSIARQIVTTLIPGIDYIPGTGIVLGLVGLFLLGLLMSSRWMRKLFELIELPFRSIPLVKSLYTAIKELTDYLTPSDRKRADKVVVIRIPDQPVEMIGFVMREELGQLPQGISRNQRCAVYIPMSYQIGGFTLFLPQQWLTPLNIPVEEAMKNTLTGWATTGNLNPQQQQ